MAGEATIATSEAILKTRYKDGRLPKTNYQSFKFFSTVKKSEDFTGDNKVFALQNENPQGASTGFPDALTALAPGSYNRFTVTPVNFYSVARIRGDALKRAQGNAATFVDLWTNETEGASQTAVKAQEIYCQRNGTGVLATLNGGTVTTSTPTISQPADAVNLDIGMLIQLVSSATSLSPTIRSSGATAKIIAINRVTGQITVADPTTGVATNLDTLIAAAGVNDSIVRAGTAAVGGTASVTTGLQLWIAGQTSPGTLFGCNRNTDPVRLAGQIFDGTGVGMEDALIEAEAMLITQGFAMEGLVAYCNPADLKEFKKSLIGKETFPKTEMKSSVAGLSFSVVEYEGESGPIKLVSNPFTPKGELQLLDMSVISFESAGPAPQLMNYDSNQFLRITTDDLWQVSFATYGQLFVYQAVKCIRVTNWGTA